MRRGILVMGTVLGAGACLTGCAAGGSAAADQPLRVTGTVTSALTAEQLGQTAYGEIMWMGKLKKQDDFYSQWLGEDCGALTEADLSGAEVVVRGPKGTVLAVGHVSNHAEVIPSDRMHGYVIGVSCQWQFSVSHVARIGGPYAVSINNTPDIHFTASELTKPLHLSFD